MPLPMLLTTINCSISNEKKHLKLDELIDLVKHFNEKKPIYLQFKSML